MSTNQEEAIAADAATIKDRDAYKPFYLTVIETNPGVIELDLEPGTDFDTREQAEAYLRGEVAQYGVGGHVYHCVRVSGMSIASDEDPDELG